MPDRHTRRRLVAPLAHRQGGVISRRQLAALGIDRHDVRSEVTAGRWQVLGPQVVAVAEVTGEGRYAAALLGVRGLARLDGTSALIYCGLTGWREDAVHVSVPHDTHVRSSAGVRVHRVRGLEPPAVGIGLATSHPTYAVIRAASWARSDRAAATIVAMAVQQGVVQPDRLITVWRGWQRRIARRALIDQVVRDVCDGAHSLGELDFARLCRRRGLPEPDRQVVRRGPRGRIYLDVRWSRLGVVVEVDGAQHGWGLAPVDDALRQNTVVLDGDVVLRVPVLGLRVSPEPFMDQVERALAAAERRLAG
ncbi:type IV toxin-antitoxin system AbiEi family antitoxin domain-containing protein [Luteipulveratus flavus]|uniref:Type IV toxin-antitoxin system AbiEi family antitoxin domain-containing protein n=1 Tax=Luteipulveratus flavus TaxID=3031728 RepID=A0ABT6C6H3_9MICO|nr:type IV toxin-antitoxin system AbiEi family antitoxin domain-containing protein [Luteipulveratus sp. YIM 133296]MDF8264509.1 type IV toxin-antitoxin system AbiEi family antitoxin domain-containing protein [Luteipulveratus sp. YIM 133296]